jgi:hypothetical protein
LDLLWNQKADKNEEKAEEVKKKEASPGISQDDLDALWAGLGGAGDVVTTAPEVPVKEEVALSNSISQADLDALWGDLDASVDTAPKKKEEPVVQGISQDDLNALWGGLTTEQSAPAQAVGAPSAVAEPAKASEHLSQDDIDRLLEEMLG